MELTTTNPNVSLANHDAVAHFTQVRTDTYPYVSPEKADLSGKSVFIAGASKGIGRETALSYAKAGCTKIAIGARSDLTSLAEEIKTISKGTPPHVVSLKLDVTSQESVKAAANTIAKEFGGALDILICNAGNLEEWNLVAESKPDEWWSTWEINVKGPYLLNRFFIPLLLKSELKTSILTSSYGSLVTWPGASAYQSTKFAVCRLAEFIATEYGSEGLVCYPLHPGAIRTELALNLPKDLHAHLNDTLALPADTIVWLTKEHRPWLSGRFVSVAWDMEELLSKKDMIVKDNLLKFRVTTS
ncbi:NAD(P)-binding protein [Xylariaceae sp. AK1471]|nr:NAD(P)-binding protein [Xylariaceae sp. AK1471]